MKEIVRIVIRGSSGYCSTDKAYEDKVTISGDLISYAYRPLFEYEENFPRNWRYKTVRSSGSISTSWFLLCLG